MYLYRTDFCPYDLWPRLYDDLILWNFIIGLLNHDHIISLSFRLIYNKYEP
jgi:hypothetical protein